MRKMFYGALVSALLLLSSNIYAQVTVSGNTDGTCEGVGVSISSITITESSNNDFFLSSGVTQTLVFVPTSGSLSPGSGSVSFTTGDVDAQINVTASEITVTLLPASSTSEGTTDVLTISGLYLFTTTPGVTDIRLNSATVALNGLSVNDPVASVQVHPSPVIVSDVTTICGSSPVNYDVEFNHNTVGNGLPSTTFNWSADFNPNVSGASGGSGTVITDVITNTSGATQGVTYRVYATSSFGCISSEMQLNVTVNNNAIPAITSANGNPEICIGATTTYTTEAGNSNYIWTVTGHDSHNPTGNTVSVTWPASPGAGEVRVSYETPEGCTAVAEGIFNVSIEDNGPTQSPTVAPAVCSGVPIYFNLNDYVGGSSNFTYTAADNPLVNGESTTPVNSPAITDNVDNFVSTTENVVYTVAGEHPYSGCLGVPFTVTIPIHPAPTGVDATTSSCSDTGMFYDLADNVSTLGNGLTISNATWTATGDFQISGYANGSGTTLTDVLNNNDVTPNEAVYSVIAQSDDGCYGPVFTVTVTVNPGPSIIGPPSVCTGGAASFFASNPTGSFTWDDDDSGNSTSDGGGNFDNFIEVSYLTDNNYTISVNYANTFGCSGTAYLPVVATSGTPTLSDGFPSICSNVVSNHNLNTDINNGIPALSFSWVAGDNPFVTGESTTPKAGALLNDNIENITNVNQTVVYAVTPTGACGPGSSFNVTLIVGPEPHAQPSTDIVACTGKSINFNVSTLLINTGMPAPLYSWKADTNGDVVEGYSHTTPQNGTIIGDSPILVGGVNTTEIVYRVIPTSQNFCVGDEFLVNVTMDQAPNAPLMNTTLCSGSVAAFNLQDHMNTLGNAVPSTFNWIASDNIDVMGESLSLQTSSVINNTLANVGPSPKSTVIYNVTPFSLNGCSGNDFTVLTDVNKVPSAPAPSSATLCSGNATAFDIAAYYAAIGNGVPVSSHSWSAVDNASITGESTSAQSTQNIADVLTNTTSVPQNVQYNIILNGAAGCNSTPLAYAVAVNPLPITIFNNNAPTISNNGSTNIALDSDVAGANYTYTASAPPEITGASSGPGGSILQILTNSTMTPQVVTYSASATANGCTGAIFQTTVTVNGIRTIVTADSVALVAFYNALNGAGWTTKTNWLTGAANTWQGVSVASERVTVLELPSNNLNGTLPAALFNLSQLTELNVSNNAISGTLPPEVDDLTSLQILDVSDNDMDGDLPDNLYSLTNLTELYLDGNDFTGSISPLVSSLTNIQTFHAEHLPMTGPIPSQIFDLTTLVHLGISGKLNGPVPASIGTLTSLMSFECDSCAITGLPAQITTLPNLTSLKLYNNDLTTIPDFSAMSLSLLDVGKNNLTFESLEPNVGVAGFSYLQQDSIGVADEVVIETTGPYTIDPAVGGSNNQYVWKKNNTVISGSTASTYTIASPVFSDEGDYFTEITNSVVPGLTLIMRPLTIKVSSLERDSLSLVHIYNSTNGNSWTNKTGWKTGSLSTWQGVVLGTNRVVGLNLPNNNLDGPLPKEFTDMRSVTTSNLSGNKLTSIPVVTSMNLLTSLNVATNKISFGSLEANVSVLSKLTYSPQADIGTFRNDTTRAGNEVLFNGTTSGAANVYQWKRNNTSVAGATSAQYLINSINKSNMGTYTADITNTLVPGLTLHTVPQTVLAGVELSGILFAESDVPATKGTVTLLRVRPGQAFDTTSVFNVSANGEYRFRKVVLDDYQLVGFADRSVYPKSLPTYYHNTLLWEEADTLYVTEDLSGLDILFESEPAPSAGGGSIGGFLEEDDGTGGRIKKAKRVESSGVSARRVEGTGRGKEEKLTLVAYVFTNANGEFNIDNLPVGNYRLNIQYPGYPMDLNSFINFTIGTGLQSEVKVEAFVEQGKINVRQLIITDIWNREGYSAQVFPNPTSTWIDMNFAASSAYREIGIFDVTGKEIRRVPAPDVNLRIDVSSFTKGNYLLNVREKGDLVKAIHVIVE